MTTPIKKGASLYCKLILFVVSFATHAQNRDPECEFRLISAKNQPRLYRRFEDVFGSILATKPMRFDRHATLNAGRRFNLNSDMDALTITLARRPNQPGTVDVLASNGGKAVYRASFEMPPLFVWRKTYEGELVSEARMGVPVPDSAIGWREFGVGAAFENGSEMRKYVSIEQLENGESVVSLGLDVDCRIASLYTVASTRRYIAVRPHSYLCRIPVLRTPALEAN